MKLFLLYIVYVLFFTKNYHFSYIYLLKILITWNNLCCLIDKMLKVMYN